MDFSILPIEQLLNPEGFECTCGKRHKTALKYLEIGQGAINSLSDVLKKCGVKKPFVVCDKNTYVVAGERVLALLNGAGIDYASYIFPQDKIEPEEYTVGQVTMSFDPSCDFIIAVGTGVINDICKIVAKTSGREYLIVGTAPSMDGFASNSSSMVWNGIKSTIYTVCPVAIIADIEIMCNAPMLMIQAGLGDMIAKFVSICEWRMSNIITNEYFCPQIAQLMRNAVKKCVASTTKLCERDPQSVLSVTEGLILSGIAMSFAEISRPASGLEHYFSHIFDMYSLEKGTDGSLHGIQVGIGTVLTLSIYDKLRVLKPNRETALAYVEAFDYNKWEHEMHRMFGKTAANLIDLEKQCGKNDKEKHTQRLEVILINWERLQAVMSEELPSADDMIALLNGVGAPVKPIEIGIQNDEVYDALMASKEIRDKYIASRLLWDLGLLDQYAKDLVETL